MDTKVSTKTWTEHSDRSPVSQSTKAMNLSAKDQKELMGGKGLDQVLNEIADPKYVDPSKARKPQGKLDKDAFLKLMLTQLKYQDPMSPLQSHEMAAQLAQFSSLEQLSNIDNSIKGLQKTQDPMANYQALNFIGKSVSADTEKIIRAKGDTNHDLRFQLPQAAHEVTIEIKDDTGAVVKTMKANNLKKGENKVAWNGTKEDGYGTYAGTYTFSVKAVADNGSQFNGRTSFGGTVTGLNYTNEGPILMIGDQKVRLSDVKKIEDPAEKAALELKDQQRMAPTLAVPAMMAAPTAPSAEAKPTPVGIPTAATLGTPASAQVPIQTQMKSEAAKTAIHMPSAKPEKKDKQASTSDGAQERPKGNIDMVPMNDELRNVVTKESNLKG
jgi:flagellar basal-body rod modification protein FlgD